MNFTGEASLFGCVLCGALAVGSSLWTTPLQAALQAASAECPKGAEYLATAADLPGAVAVAAEGSAFLVATPEAIQPRERVMRVELGGDGAVKSPCTVGVSSGESNAASAGSSLSASFAPIALDVAPDGTVAVADASGVVRIGRDTSWRVFGTNLFEEPSGITFHPQGVVVADRRKRALILCSREGVERARLGEGQLGDPRGVAALDDGTVLVADRLHDCIWRFAASNDGAPNPKGVAIGEFGSSPGQFNAPGDVAVRGQGTSACIFVADELNHRIQVFDRGGSFVGFFGMHALIPRMGEGKIHYPRGVAISADGATLAVAEAFEDRVQLFTLTAEAPPPPLTKSLDLISSHFGSDVACAGDVLALVDIESEAVGILDARTTPPIHVTLMGGSGASPQRFREVSAIAIEPQTRRVWIADRARNVVDVYALAFDPAKEPVVDLFMPSLARSMRLEDFARRLQGASDGRTVRTPDLADIAFASVDGRTVLLLDRANMAVIQTDPRFAVGQLIALPEAAHTPEELAVASDGSWAIPDPIAQSVFVRSPTGEWRTLRALGEIEFVRPSGVEFLDDGAMVVSDAARDGVIVGTPEGPARFVGEKGGLDEQFWDPQAIVRSPRGHIVVDRGNHRFQRFGDGFTWNLTGSMGRYYDRKRRGSPGAPAIPSAPPIPGAPSGPSTPTPSRTPTTAPIPSVPSDSSEPPARQDANRAALSFGSLANPAHSEDHS